MSRRRLTAIVAGVVILMAVIVRVVVAGSGGAADVAVDTTGASAQAAVSPAPTSSARQAAPGRGANRTGSTPSPSPAQVEQTAVSVVTKPILVLSPKTVRQGASIGVWGSGFLRGATVDIYVKQKASDIVNPVTFVQADRSGQFGGVTVTIPDSVPRGSLMIEAKERQSSLTATAAATVADGADDAQVVTQATTTLATPTAGVAATPTAASAATASPTTAPKVAAQPQSAPDSKPIEEPRTAPQPQPTPQPKPTEQPQPTPQPKATPQPKPTEQPQPTTPPGPQPAEQPQAKPDTPHSSPAPSSYTVQAGDSLSDIAEHVYGNANEWKELYEANRGAIGGNPNLIHPGTELVLPPKD